jgi:hypothetical protein
LFAGQPDRSSIRYWKSPNLGKAGDNADSPAGKSMTPRGRHRRGDLPADFPCVVSGDVASGGAAEPADFCLYITL